MSTFWESLVAAGEWSWAAEEKALFPAAALTQTVANAVQPAVSASPWLQAVEQNLAALAVGAGLFTLGALMIAFSSFDELSETAQKVAQRIPPPLAEAVV